MTKHIHFPLTTAQQRRLLFKKGEWQCHRGLSHRPCWPPHLLLLESLRLYGAGAVRQFRTQTTPPEQSSARTAGHCSSASALRLEQTAQCPRTKQSSSVAVGRQWEQGHTHPPHRLSGPPSRPQNKLYLDRPIQLVADEDLARLSPLGYEYLYFLGRFSFALTQLIAKGAWRPLRQLISRTQG